MSYILEALKESQRSRDEQQVPDIMTVHGIPEPENEQPARSSWILPLVMLVCVAAAAGWWFAGSKQVGDDRVTEALPSGAEFEKAQEAITAQAVEPVETTAPNPRSPGEMKQAEPQAEQLIATDPVAKTVMPSVSVEQTVGTKPVARAPAPEPEVSLPEKVMPKAVVITEQPQPVVKEVKTVVKQEVAPAPVAPVVSAPAVSDIAAIEVEAEAVAVDGPLLKEPVPALSSAEEQVVEEQVAEEVVVAEPSTENVSVSPEPERVPHFRELPYDVQQAVSGVKYSVHLYSPDPSRRLVKINGIVRREGSEVSPGLVLDQVTPDGAIFTYREYRFRVPVR